MKTGALNETNGADNHHEKQDTLSHSPAIVTTERVRDETSATSSESEEVSPPHIKSSLGELDIADVRALGTIDTVDFAMAQLAEDMSIRLPSTVST